MINIGVVGVNVRGHGYHYALGWNAEGPSRHCRVTHAWDPDPSAAQEFLEKAPDVQLLDTPQAVAEATDGGMVATLDPDEYLGLARLWLDAGKPVFVNRPFAGHPKDARSMMALAEEHRTRVWSASALAIVPALAETRERIDALGGPLFFVSSTPGKSPLFYLPHALAVTVGILGVGVQRVLASRVRHPAFASLLEPVPCDAEIPDVTGTAALIEFGETSSFGPFLGAVSHQIAAKGAAYTFGAQCADGVVEPLDCGAGGGLFDKMVDGLDQFFAGGEAPSSTALALHVCEIYHAIRLSLKRGQAVGLSGAARDSES